MIPDQEKVIQYTMRIRKRTIAIFALTLAFILAMLATSVFKTDAYNKKTHHTTFTGDELFTEEATGSKPLSVSAFARSSILGLIKDKNFDFDLR